MWQAPEPPARGRAERIEMVKTRGDLPWSSPTRSCVRADRLARYCVQGEHGDPHHVLGFHKVDGRTVVRAYRPDASAVRVLLGGGKTVDAEKVHDAGIFVADVSESAGDAGYRLEVSYPSGDTIPPGV